MGSASNRVLVVVCVIVVAVGLTACGSSRNGGGWLMESKTVEAATSDRTGLPTSCDRDSDYSFTCTSGWRIYIVECTSAADEVGKADCVWREP